MTEEEIQKAKDEIDAMSHIRMAALVRFATPGHAFFRSDLPLHDYFMKRFKELGGMTVEVSKQVSWSR